MSKLSNRKLRGRWRRALFWAWVVSALLVFGFAAIGGPIADTLGSGRAIVALASPALMAFMLATGLGWLVLLVMSQPRRNMQSRR